MNIKDRILRHYLIAFFVFLIGAIIALCFSKYCVAIILFVASLSSLIINIIFKIVKLNLIAFEWLYNGLYLITIIIVLLFLKTNLYQKISIYEFSFTLESSMKIQENGIYKISYGNIKNQKDEIVLRKNFFTPKITGGQIIVQEGKISYKLQIEDKCMYKGLNEEKYSLEEINCLELKKRI